MDGREAGADTRYRCRFLITHLEELCPLQSFRRRILQVRSQPQRREFGHEMAGTQRDASGSLGKVELATLAVDGGELSG